MKKWHRVVKVVTLVPMLIIHEPQPGSSRALLRPTYPIPIIRLSTHPPDVDPQSPPDSHSDSQPPSEPQPQPQPQPQSQSQAESRSDSHSPSARLDNDQNQTSDDLLAFVEFGDWAMEDEEWSYYQ